MCCLPSLLGAAAYDRDGVRLGHVADVLFGATDHRPAWVVLAPLRAERRVVVPAAGLRHHVAGVRLGCDAAQVRTAPGDDGVPGELGGTTAARVAAHFAVPCPAGPWRGLVEPGVQRPRVAVAADV